MPRQRGRDESLNPPEIRPWGSKALINACMDYRFYKTFSKRTKLSKDAYEKVVGRWQELGMSGEPPTVTIFEDETFPDSVTWSSACPGKVGTGFRQEHAPLQK